MACQGTPTATQFQTSVETSYAERTVYSTILVTNPLRVRQGPTDSGSTPTPTDSASLTSTSSGGFGIKEVSTITQTFTLTDTFFFTNTIPAQTLYAPCSTSESSTRSTSTLSSTSVSVDPGILTDLSISTMHSDGMATTTSGGVTIIISEFITTVNGVATIYATPVQTLLNTSNSVLNDGQRTAVIAGSAVGAVFVFVALLGLLFFVRRTRQVHQRRLEEKQAKKRPPRNLLEGEADDFDFASRNGAPMMSQHWDSTSFASGGSSSAPRLLRARGSRTGSLFQEDVWPPPNEVMEDPLITSHDLGSSISLAMGFPVDNSLTSQSDVSPIQPHSATGISSADAYAFGALPVDGNLHQQRSSAYDSIRSADSADYYYHGRSHSRAESTEPLLDDAGRTISPPPLQQRSAALTTNQTTSPTNTMDRRIRGSNLRVSYTADNAGYNKYPTRLEHFRSGTQMSGQSVGSFSPQTEMQTSPEEGGMHGIMNGAGSHGTGNERTEELPPLYHTISRDAS